MSAFPAILKARSRIGRYGISRTALSEVVVDDLLTRGRVKCLTVVKVNEE